MSLCQTLRLLLCIVPTMAYQSFDGYGLQKYQIQQSQLSLMQQIVTPIPGTESLSGKVTSTPTPTHPGELLCGSHTNGEYNGVALEVEVRMTCNGTMTMDLSASDFAIKSITAYDQLVTLNDTNPSPSIITIRDLVESRDYYFIIEGAHSVQYGTFDIVIECSPDSVHGPTQSPWTEFGVEARIRFKARYNR